MLRNSDSDSPLKSLPRVISSQTAEHVRSVLNSVVSEHGTGFRAAVPGYHIAGKTGTVRKLVGKAYAPDKYISLFAGMAPASDPKLVLVVMVDEPSKGAYYGGAVAAPVFSKIMSGALRILDVAPDNVPLRAGTVHPPLNHAG